MKKQALSFLLLVGMGTFPAGAHERWTVINPYPLAGDGQCVAWGETDRVFVAFGQAGAAIPHRSADGADWTGATAVALGLNAVIHDGDRFVAVGGNGAEGLVATSVDGRTWNSSGAGIGGVLKDITFNPQTGRYTAVGHNGGSGLILHSTNLANWTTESFPSAGIDLETVTEAGGVRFAAGRGGTSSPQGVIFSDASGSWALVATTPGKIFDLAYGGPNNGTSLVAVQEGGFIHRSSDGGITWPMAGSTPVAPGALYAVCHDANAWVAVGAQGFVAWSTDSDATNWTLVPALAATNWRDVTVGNGFLVAVGDQGAVATTPAQIVTDPTSPPRVEPGAGMFPAAGGTMTLQVSAPEGTGPWSATFIPAAPWASVDPSSGADNAGVTLSVAPNANAGERIATLRFSFADGSIISMPVSQEAGMPPRAPGIFASHGGDGVNVEFFGDDRSESYRVERREGPDAPWLTVATVPGEGRRFALLVESTLTAGVEYCWRAYAINSAGESSASAVTCLLAPVPPPGNVQVVTLAPTEARISWDAVSGASRYRIEFAEWETGPWTELAELAGGLEWHALLQPDTTYWIRVSAQGEGTPWAPAAPVPVTTPAATVQYEWNMVRAEILRRPERSSIAYGNGRYVVVGSGASGGAWAETSTDAESWTGTPIPNQGALRDIRFRNGLFLAVGESGTVLTSADGVTWTPRNPSLGGQDLLASAYGNGLWVVVGQGGKVVYSSDLNSWSEGTSGESGDLIDVDFADGDFAAIADDGDVLRSVNGSDWVEVRDPDFAYGESIFHLGGNWWATESGRSYATSPDLLTWTEGSLPPQPSFSAGLSRPAENAGQVVALSPLTVHRSDDGGATWTHVPGPLSGQEDYWTKIVFGAAGFTALSEGGAVAVSIDGVAWQETRADQSNGIVNGIASGAGRLVLVSGRRVLSRSISARGGNWDEWTAPDRLREVAHLDGVFYAVGERGVVLKSIDGLVWTELANRPTPSDLSHVAFGSATLIVAGEGGIWFSTDSGSSWSAASGVESGSEAALFYGDGRFVGLGGGGLIISSDGRNWTSPTGYPSADQIGREGGTGGWGVAGRHLLFETYAGYTSSDGTNWQKFPKDGSLSFFDLLHTGSHWIATGYSDGEGVWASRDGIYWSPSGLVSGHFYGTAGAYVDGEVVVGGNLLFPIYFLTVSAEAGGAGEIAFSTSATSVAEPTGGHATLDIQVERRGGSEGEVGVTLSVAGRTATPGIDFADPGSVELRWSDGDLSPKHFDLEIHSDELAEGPEQMILSLTSPQGGAQLGGSSLVATIEDAPFQDWVFQQDGIREISGEYAPAADQDGDGVNTWLEWVLGLSPKAHDSRDYHNRLRPRRDAAGRLFMTVRHRVDVDVVAEVDNRLPFQSPTTVTVAPAVLMPDDGSGFQTSLFVDPVAGHPRRFMRLVFAE